MASIKGTKTEKNLLAAFAGESQARNRYNFFAKQAKKEGFEQIAAIFFETAENERQHAKEFFKFLEGGPVEITATYPAGVIGDTRANLKAAAAGENEEWTKLYKEAGDIAQEEGFSDIARKFWKVAEVEQEHEKRYLTLLANLDNGQVFKKEIPVRWKCRVCGYIHESAEALLKCPVCVHPQAHFELAMENY
jgi:rubrerythrin